MIQKGGKKNVVLRGEPGCRLVRISYGILLSCSKSDTSCLQHVACFDLNSQHFQHIILARSTSPKKKGVLHPW